MPFGTLRIAKPLYCIMTKMKNPYLFLIFFLAAHLVSGQDGIKPIIDVHLHGFTPNSYKYIEGSPPTFGDFKNEMRKVFKTYNIVYAVKSGGQYDEDMEANMLEGYESNKLLDTIEFKRLIKQGKIQVWGEIQPMFNGMTLADDAYAPYLKICEQEGIPIALHTGRGPTNIHIRYPNYRLALGDPLLLEPILIKYPKLKIYLMHAGLPFYENTLALMDSYPQVFVDLGWILYSYRKITKSQAKDFLRKVKKYDMIDRVMFGSDCMYWPDELENSIKKLDSFEFLNEEDKRKIFYENAVKFFELDIKKK